MENFQNMEFWRNFDISGAKRKSLNLKRKTHRASWYRATASRKPAMAHKLSELDKLEELFRNGFVLETEYKARKEELQSNGI